MDQHDIKNKILNSLLELMKKNSLSKIFVKDIADLASVSRQTFYTHFKDKYDVLNWYYDISVENLFVEAKTVEDIRTNLIKKIRFYKENNHIFKNAYQCIGQNSLSDHEFKLIYNSLYRKASKNTVKLNDEKIKKFEFALMFYVHGVIGMTIDWINNDCNTSSEELTNMLIELMPEDVKLNIDD